ncbi:extracellular SCP domain protein Pry1 [Cladophialophora carrionii]|uniref:Extracellular SCP domain protein Pry1 n=1 Tax=Cladophialophora carrionii TaxID=86049 RepID=A0A1C1CDH9_9EURO|nr:extracellular SCP domain protein Pry1 [Cladophialophora carrionii]
MLTNLPLCAALLLALPLSAFGQETVTVIGTTVTQTFTAAASTTPTSPQYTDSLTFRESILNSSNTYRYQHSASYLYWNETLATYAQSYSENCLWEHSHGPYGENLARGYPDVTSAVDAWGDERAMYDFSTTDPTGFTEATGHFTQLVWQGTQATGCGWTDCEGRNGLEGIYLVCEYWPVGNIVGEDNMFFIQNVLPERSGGSSGFNELEATRGATGGTPTSTGSPSATGANTASATSSGESIGAPMAEVDRKGLLVTVCVTLAALLFGLGMS